MRKRREFRTARVFTPVLIVVLLLGTMAALAAGAAPSTVRTSRNAGAGSAETSMMTPDGSREVMVGRGTGNAGVWLVDRTANDATYHITTGMDMNAAISADGKTIAYVQYGSSRQVFVRDVTDPANPGAAVLVSSTGTGGNVVAGNGLSDFPSLNANGSLVAFQSTATNLTNTPLPSSGGPNKVYIHDVASGANEMISVDNSGAAQPGNAIKPSVSDDGNIVAFASDADLGGPPSGAAEETTTFNQVWVRNRTAGTTQAASVSSEGVLGNAGSALVYGPSINADGTRVAFESDATNLVAADTNTRTDAFVHDMSSGATTRVSERTAFDQFGAFHALTPARLIDTRLTGTKIGPGQSIDVQVQGVGGVPAEAVGAALNITVTEGTAVSHFTVYPTGEVMPLASTLNFVAAQNRANAMQAKLGAGGKVTVFNVGGEAHVVIDVNGWYDAASVDAGGGYVSTPPTRLLDTRTSGVPLGPGESVDVQMIGVAGVPSTATAVAFNLTAVEATGPTHLTAYPTGEALPLASNVNVSSGDATPNLVIAKIGADGKVSIHNHSGSVHVIVDLGGWFDSTLPGGGFTPVTPARLLDTRTGGVPLGSGQSLTLGVVGTGGVPATGVTTVALNVTVTGPTGPSHLTVYPTGTPEPLASNLNFVAGQTVANEVIVQAGADGMVTIFNAGGSVHVVVDVTGWYSGTQVSEGGAGPAISADGQHVAFESLSSTLTTGDVNGVLDAFVRDLDVSVTERVSVVDETTGGTEATGTRTDGHTGEIVPQKNGADVTISGDGALVAFTSNGNLANDRPAGEEPGTISTEAAIFTRTRS